MNEINRLDNFLESKEPFDLELETVSVVNKGLKLLFPPVNSTKIGRRIPTLTKYDYSGVVLRASHMVEAGEFLTGIGVLDEWREIPGSSEFNVYGFDYDPGFDDFRFRAAKTENDSTALVPVEFKFETREANKLRGLCLSRAFIDLSLPRVV
jgi:hypothetical protein